MSKTFKMALVALILIPCMLLLVACGDNIEGRWESIKQQQGTEILVVGDAMDGDLVYGESFKQLAHFREDGTVTGTVVREGEEDIVTEGTWEKEDGKIKVQLEGTAYAEFVNGKLVLTYGEDDNSEDTEDLDDSTVLSNTDTSGHNVIITFKKVADNNNNE